MGLAQRELEAAGLTTVIFTPVPALAVAVGAPRVAAIEYPLGRTFGQPGDAAGQRAVLRAALEAAAAMTAPGAVAHLPFTWPEPPAQTRSHPPTPPPIVEHLKRHPWELPRLLFRDPARARRPSP